MIKFNVKIDRSAFRRESIRVWQQDVKPIFQNIADRMRTLMLLPKTGKLYGTHRASAPGEAPAPLTEALINSIGQPQVDDGIIRLIVSDPKARLLDPQEGDPINALIEPRPFVQPSIDGAVAAARKPGIVASIF